MTSNYFPRSEIKDLQVDTLIFALLLDTGSLVLSAELLLAFVLLLGPRNVKFLTLEIRVVKNVYGLSSAPMLRKVDETESTVLAILIAGDSSRSDSTKLGKKLSKLLIRHFGLDVLDVDVSKVSLHLVELALAVLLGDVVSDKDFLFVQKHAVDVLDGVLGSLGSLVMNEPISARVAELVLSDLAGKDIAKGSKGIVECLVVDSGIEVLDEDVALTSLAEKGITL